MTLTPFIAYALALAVAAAIPGPGVAALVGRSLTGDLRASFGFLGGVVLGDITYLTVAVLGLAVLVEVFAGALLAVKIAGGLYLLYLAYQFWTAEAEALEAPKKRARSGLKALASGYAVTLGNPKTIVFYMALLPTVLDLEAVGVAEWSVLALVTAAVLIAVMTPYALVAAKARAVLTRPRALRRLNRGAAVLIGGAGALILGDAARAGR